MERAILIKRDIQSVSNYEHKLNTKLLFDFFVAQF